MPEESPPNDEETLLLPYDYHVPPDVSLDQCITDWTEGEVPAELLANIPSDVSDEFPYAVGYSLNLELPSKTLLMLAQGDLSAGNLRIISSQELRKNMVYVRVIAHYQDQATMDATKVCRVRRGRDERGVGIFVRQSFQLSCSTTDQVRHPDSS
jgi:hypothetical protein